MITAKLIRLNIHRAVGMIPAEEPNPELCDAIADVATRAVMDTLERHLFSDGLIITTGGGPHLLDANDKTVWRAEAVAGVAAHVDPDSGSAAQIIVRRYGRKP